MFKQTFFEKKPVSTYIKHLRLYIGCFIFFSKAVSTCRSHSSPLSTRGRGGRSVHSSHGPILSAVEGLSSRQTTVWTNLVQPGDRRTAPWSAPVWEGWNSISDVACHAQTALAGTLSGIRTTWPKSERRRRRTINWILSRPDLV